ncbi:MAG: AMP-binding protein, partial [Gammaproteobacteria bacterium]|nr:AMP-binding protein [Gammaproteobacteria bacterium]
LPCPGPDDPATLFYTSGTTGRPKGVPLDHANLAFQIRAVAGAGVIGKNDRIALPLPLHHVYPFVIGMLAPLALGVALIIPYSLTGPQVVRALREGGATVMVGVPRLYSAMYTGILDKVKAKGSLAETVFNAILALSIGLRRRLGIQVGKRLFGSLHRQVAPGLRVLACGGAPLNPDLAWKLEGLGWQVSIGYGLTETAPLLTMNLPGSSRLDSIGRVVDGVDLKIDTAVRGGIDTIDNRNEITFPQGEILARGPNVFKGYRGLPEQTAAAFTDDGWFRTGDLGYVDAKGYVYITGRIKELIVTEGGENIQPDAVEEIYSRHPSIREFALMQKDGRLIGLVVPEVSEIHRSGLDALAPAIHQAIAEQTKHVPSYQRIQDYVLIREPLPRTRLGKLRRHLLPGLYDQAHALETAGDKTDVGPMSVTDMVGEDIALLENPVAREIWDWLAARYPDERLTPETSPQLDLGIDSLEWVALTLEIDQRFGLQLSAEALSRIDTVRDLLCEATEAPVSGTGSESISFMDTPERVIGESQKRSIEPLNPVQSAISSAMHMCNRLVMKVFFRLQVEGAENLREGGQYVFTPNHTSALDPFVLAAAMDMATHRRTYWMAWTGIAFRSLITRTLSRLSRALPINRDRSALAGLAMGAVILDRGYNLVLFPEGRRSDNDELQPFRPGVGLLLERFPVPVIPVYIQGTHAAMPTGQKWPRLRRLDVILGAPLLPQELARQGTGQSDAERITHALQEQVAGLGEKLSS